MVMRITEMAGTFNSQLRELKINEVSPLYEDELSDITNDVYRVDMPQELSIRLGLLYNDGYVHVTSDTINLIFSAFDIEYDPLQSIRLKTFLYKPKGNPRSKELSVDHDAQFVCIPKYFVEGFNTGDNLSWTYVHETEDTERHVTCHVS
jgi:hypothetical protein